MDDFEGGGVGVDGRVGGACEAEGVGSGIKVCGDGPVVGAGGVV